MTHVLVLVLVLALRWDAPLPPLRLSPVQAARRSSRITTAERQRDQIFGKGGGDGDEGRGEGRGGCPRLADDDEDVGGGGRSWMATSSAGLQAASNGALLSSVN